MDSVSNEMIPEGNCIVQNVDLDMMGSIEDYRTPDFDIDLSAVEWLDPEQYSTLLVAEPSSSRSKDLDLTFRPSAKVSQSTKDEMEDSLALLNKMNETKKVLKTPVVQSSKEYTEVYHSKDKSYVNSSECLPESNGKVKNDGIAMNFGPSTEDVTKDSLFLLKKINETNIVSEDEHNTIAVMGFSKELRLNTLSCSSLLFGSSEDSVNSDFDIDLSAVEWLDPEWHTTLALEKASDGSSNDPDLTSGDTSLDEDIYPIDQPLIPYQAADSHENQPAGNLMNPTFTVFQPRISSDILFISNYNQALTAGHDSVLCHVDDYCLRRLHQLELHTLCLTYSTLIDLEQSLMVDLRDYHWLRGERESIRVRDQRYEDKEAELSILWHGPKYTTACSEEWKDLDPEKAFELLEDKVSSCIVHQSICKSVIDVKFEKFRASQEQCTTLLLDNQRRLAKRKMKGMKYVSSYKECKAERRKERQRERERKMCTVKTFLPWFKADSNRAIEQLNLRPPIRHPFYNPRRFFCHADSQNERRELILKRLRAAYHIKHMQHCQVSDNTARDLALSVETEDRGDRERANDIRDTSKTTVKEKGMKVECCEGAHLLQEEGGGTSKQSKAKLYSGHGCMDNMEGGICQRQTELISIELMTMGIGIGRKDQELDNDDVNKTSKVKSTDSVDHFNKARHEEEQEREKQSRKRRNKTKDQEDATGIKGQNQEYQRASDCMETQIQHIETANSCTETSTKIESNAQAKLKQDSQPWQGKDKHQYQCNTKEGPQEEIKTHERDAIERERENSIPDSQTQEQRGQSEKINGRGETPNKRPNRENWFDHRDDESQEHQRWVETRGTPFRTRGRWMETNNVWDRDIAREDPQWKTWGSWRKERRYNKKDTEVRTRHELVMCAGETMDGEVRKDKVRKDEDTTGRRPRRQTRQCRRQRPKSKQKEPHPSDSSIDWRNREDKWPERNKESIMDRKRGTWAASNMACESDNLCDPAVLVSTTNPEPHIRNRRLSPGSGNCGGGGGCSIGVDQQPRQTSPGAIEGSLNGPTHAHTFRRDRERRAQQHKGRGPRREGLRGAGRVADRPPKQSSKERWVENSLSLLKPPPAFPVQDSPAKLQPAVSYASKVKAGAAGGALEDDRPAIGVLLQNQWGLSFISEVLQASEGSGCVPGPTELSQPSDDSEPAEEALLTIQYGSDMLVPATNMITIGQCPDEEEGNGKLLLSCRHLVEALKYHSQEWNTICNKRKQDPKKVVWFKNSLEHPA